MKPAIEKDETVEELDAETMAALDIGLESERTGRDYTLDEAIRFARERRAQWATIPESLNG